MRIVNIVFENFKRGVVCVKCFKFYLGMIEASTGENFENIVSDIRESSKISPEEKFQLYQKIIKVCYKRELFKEIKSITSNFGITEESIKEDPFLTFAYLRSLSRLEDFEGIKRFSKGVSAEDLKEDPELGVRIISRAYTFTGDRLRAIKILELKPTFTNKMQMAFNYLLEERFSEAIKIYIDLKSDAKNTEEVTYINLGLAEIYHKKQDKVSLANVVKEIRRSVYKASKNFLIIRSLLLYNYLFYLGKEIDAYSFLEPVTGMKATSELELNKKIEVFKILIKKYNFSKKKILASTNKVESYENIKKVSLMLS